MATLQYKQPHLVILVIWVVPIVSIKIFSCTISITDHRCKMWDLSVLFIFEQCSWKEELKHNVYILESTLRLLGNLPVFTRYNKKKPRWFPVRGVT